MMKSILLVAGLVLAVSPAAIAADKVGADKCKMCHKLQYDSWAASKHAKLNPVQDCEACHGNGSGYKTIPVMKDLAKAKLAGLIIPTKADCGKCHGKGTVPAMTDVLFAKVHVHKAK